MKCIKIVSCMAACLALAACGSDDDWNGSTPSTMGMGSTTTSSTSVTGDLTNISVELDTTPLDETDVVPADETDYRYEDYVENTTWKNIFTITYNGSSVTIEGEDDDIAFTTDGAHVVVNAAKKAQYILTGTSTDGSFKIYSDSKFEVNLDGLTLTNPDGAAINSQSKKRMFLTATDGTTNTLTDGSTYVTDDEEDMKGVIFSEGQIIVSGSGSIVLNAKGKNGLASDQYIRLRPTTNIQVTSSGTNGIKANDSIMVDGGVHNITVTATAGKGFTTDGHFRMNGGRATVITSGSATYSDGDASSAAGVKADSTVTIAGGTLNLKSTGSGGKGINCDQTVTITGGTVTVITTGSQYSYSGSGSSSGFGGFGFGGGSSSSSSSTSSPKGIKADGNITIQDGTVTVRCSGTSGSEGIESKSNIYISGGDIVSYCYDDCINASGTINISGGRTYAISTGNDAVDSNYGRTGAVNISDGYLVAICTTGGVEEGIDADNNKYITISGGYVFSAGGSQGSGSSLNASQKYGTFSASFSSANYYTVADASGNNIYTFKLPCSVSSTFTVVSAPTMSSGTHTIKSGTSAPTDATMTFYDFYYGSSATGSSNLTSFTAK